MIRSKVWLKSCPRCSGDLYEAVDQHGQYIECFQCSHTLSQAEENVLFKRMATMRREIGLLQRTVPLPAPYEPSLGGERRPAAAPARRVEAVAKR